jgi:putative ABC transport system permease protein
LGAGRSRILRQLLTESVLLGVMASVLGALLALIGTRSMTAMAPPLLRLDEVGVNGTVLVFTAVVGIATGVLFGVVPSLCLSRQAGCGLVRSYRPVGSRGDSRSQHLVVSLEVALTVVLLVSSGLLIRSLAALLATDPGFQQGHLTEVRAEFPFDGAVVYGSREAWVGTLRHLQGALGSVPGVSEVSGASSMPLSGVPSFYALEIEGWNPEGEGYTPHAFISAVFPGFFKTMGIPLLAGRTLSEEDREGTPRVALISKSMARSFWPSGSALGARIIRGRDTVTVVGVVGDVRYESMEAGIRPTMYVSVRQQAPSRMSFVVRTAMDPEDLFPQFRVAVWSVAPEVPITRVNTVEALVSASTRNERFRTVVMVIFGICAILLAASGVFGVTARSVARRYREFGIRKALGASDRRLIGALLQATVLPGLVGVVLGIVGAYWTSRYLSGFLFGVEPDDPLTFLTVCAVTLVTISVATLVPADRVKAAEPVKVLRAD